jgi:hypothetical protein
MADLLSHRLINPAVQSGETSGVVADTAAALPTGVGVEVQLVMSDRALFDGDSVPALLNGQTIPAAVARRLVLNTGGPVGRKVKRWIRRLFTAPDTGELINCDQTRRLFPEVARSFLIARDQVCRTPWCGAPIRHGDHIVAFADGGPTGIANAQGLCENCNLAKELDGWTSTRLPGAVVETITPTAHRYRSHPPPPPRSKPWDSDRLQRDQLSG